MSFFDLIPFLLIFSMLSAVSGIAMFGDLSAKIESMTTWDHYRSFLKIVGIYVLIVTFWFLICAWILLDFEG